MEVSLYLPLTIVQLHMAADNRPAFDDLEPVAAPESSGDDDDVPTVKLDPGERLQGTLLSVSPKGDNGDNILRIKSEARGVVDWWDNKQVRRAFKSAGISPGDYVGIEKDDEVQTFEDDEGETVEWYKFEVRVA